MILVFLCSLWQAPDYDARQSSAVWHETEEERVRVTVSEAHIESLFCQKMEGTDGKFTGKSKNVSLKCVSKKTLSDCKLVAVQKHLPNQKKALNVNIVLDGLKRDDLSLRKKVRMYVPIQPYILHVIVYT